MSADAPRKRSDLGYLLIFVAATLWALLGVFSQRLLTSGVPALEIAYWRAALAGVVFIVH
ncbi:MAG TPA: EamA family transporter, partial [Trueperaceae bacterium]|nr:EamA family transporter [Trueperaceae bacterium]